LSISSACSGIAPTRPFLPLTHLTRFTTFEDVASTKQLPLNSTGPRAGEPATYLFYGAPFYRLPHRAPHELDIDDVDELPVALLIDPAQLVGIRAEVFPFDTGALAKGLYSPHLDPRPGLLDDYVVESRDAANDAARLVELLFGSNARYITGHGSGPSVASVVSCVETVKALQGAKLKADVRRRAIEVVALDSVVCSGAGMVVIAPQFHLARRRRLLPELDPLLSLPETTVIAYADMMPFSPTSDSRAVLDYAVKWLSQQGLLPEVP
jgi:hypothetical protein